MKTLALTIAMLTAFMLNIDKLEAQRRNSDIDFNPDRRRANTDYHQNKNYKQKDDERERNNYKHYHDKDDDYIFLNYHGKDYRYSHGRFYHYYKDRFVYVAPPFGLRIGFIPHGAVTIMVRGIPFYFYEGIFYRYLTHLRCYEVIAPPIGAIVPNLPCYNAQMMIINNETVYECNNVLYKPLLTRHGIQYKVIGSLSF